MKDFFLKISDRLEAAVPELCVIDLDKGQAEELDKRQGLDFPAALIDIAYTSCEDTGGRNQQCKTIITVRVVAAGVVDETSNVTPRAWRERSLKILDTVQAVVDALQGYDCGLSSDLSRTSQEAELRGDGLKVYRITFTSTFDEEFE